MEGEFKLQNLKKGTWKIRYTDQKKAEYLSNRKQEKKKKQTADYIEQLTGKRPPWA
jgi:hypothetical protein